MSFARYEKYKDSGVEWLGEVPEHWATLQGRRIFSQKREQALKSDEQLSSTQKYGVIPQKFFMDIEDKKVTLALSGLENFKHVEKDDFVISLRSFQGGLERSMYTGCVSPAYTVLRRNVPICSSYWAPLFKSSEYISVLQSTTDGIRDGKNISYEQFGQIWLPYPPIEEQQAIATFLDNETTKIDALIAEQQKLIELLKEKRQAVISHAVTKGLNPDVAMKDSGIEWLGEVPEHWEVKKIKYISSFLGGGTPSRENLEYWNGNIPWVSPKDMKVERIESTEENITEQGLINSSSSLIKAGNILLVVRSGILKHTIPVSINDVDVTLNQDMKALIMGDICKPEFFLYWVKGLNSLLLLMWSKQGATVESLEHEYLSNTLIPLPNSEEQEEITLYLNNETKNYDKLTYEAQQAITLLQERRTALISAAVTGKIDVRNLSPHPENEVTP